MPRSLLLLSVLVATLASRGPASEPDRPNFLVILCDDLGYGDLACYGHPHIRTPNLDRLAGEGVRLAECYASAPVCSSSRAGLLTGRNPNRVGVYDWIPDGHPTHLRSSEITIATLLRNSGYDTLHAGKWHCNGRFNKPDTPQPGDHGFAHWFATQNNAAPRHEDPVNFVRNGQPVGPMKGFSCQLVADETIQWLRTGRDPDQPFFAFVCFHEPHEPVESPDGLTQRYLDDGSAKSRDQAQYFANVENMDRAVGRLLESLDELELARDTVVFFTSDNGPETLNRYGGASRSYGSPGPLRGMKLHIYEGGIRVPGILRWPERIEAGSKIDVPVSAVDLLPTLCELAGVATPKDRALDGASVVPLFEGGAIEREKPLFWWYYRALSKPRVAMRDGRWKIVAHWDGPFLQEKANSLGRNVNRRSQQAIKTSKLVAFELYDLAEDVGETIDRSNAEPEVLETMKRKLVDIYTEIQAEGPVWETDAFWGE